MTKVWRYKWNFSKEKWICLEAKVAKRTAKQVVFTSRSEASNYQIQMGIDEFESLFGLNPVHAHNLALALQHSDFDIASAAATRELKKLQALQDIAEFRTTEVLMEGAK